MALADDEASGGVAYAELPPAVRAFFRNGGARCWIVRVAGRTAVGNTFLIPGLLTRPPAEAGVGGALALARSAGSWSDALAVNATITQRPLSTSAASPPRGGPFHRMTAGACCFAPLPFHRREAPIVTSASATPGFT